MPFYNTIDTKTTEGKRTVCRLLKLREGLDEIPEKTVDETLLLATWNIRDFDKSSYGERSEEAIFYIRTGNQTQKLNPREANEYINHHWTRS